MSMHTKLKEMNQMEAWIQSKLSAMSAAGLPVPKGSESQTSRASNLPWGENTGNPNKPKTEIKKAPVVYTQTTTTNSQSSSQYTQGQFASSQYSSQATTGSQSTNFPNNQASSYSSSQQSSQSTSQNQSMPTYNTTPTVQFQALSGFHTQSSPRQSVPHQMSTPYRHANPQRIASYSTVASSKPAQGVPNLVDMNPLLRLPPPPPPAPEAEPDPTLEKPPDETVSFWTGATGSAGTFEALEDKQPLRFRGSRRQRRNHGRSKSRGEGHSPRNEAQHGYRRGGQGRARSSAEVFTTWEEEEQYYNKQSGGRVEAEDVQQQPTAATTGPQGKPQASQEGAMWASDKYTTDDAALVSSQPVTAKHQDYTRKVEPGLTKYVCPTKLKNVQRNNKNLSSSPISKYQFLKSVPTNESPQQQQPQNPQPHQQQQQQQQNLQPRQQQQQQNLQPRQQQLQQNLQPHVQQQPQKQQNMYSQQRQQQQQQQHNQQLGQQNPPSHQHEQQQLQKSPSATNPTAQSQEDYYEGYTEDGSEYETPYGSHLDAYGHTNRGPTRSALPRQRGMQHQNLADERNYETDPYHPDDENPYLESYPIQHPRNHGPQAGRGVGRGELGPRMPHTVMPGPRAYLPRQPEHLGRPRMRAEVSRYPRGAGPVPEDPHYEHHRTYEGETPQAYGRPRRLEENLYGERGPRPYRPLAQGQEEYGPYGPHESGRRPYESVGIRHPGPVRMPLQSPQHTAPPPHHIPPQRSPQPRPALPKHSPELSQPPVGDALSLLYSKHPVLSQLKAEASQAGMDVEQFDRILMKNPVAMESMLASARQADLRGDGAVKSTSSMPPSSTPKLAQQSPQKAQAQETGDLPGEGNAGGPVAPLLSCEMCETPPFTAPKIRSHFTTKRHCLQYVKMQILLGLERFLEQFPLNGFNFSGHIPERVYGKCPEHDQDELLIWRCGLVSNSTCKVCKVNTGNQFNGWKDHVKEKSHIVKVFLAGKHFSRYDFVNKFPGIPVPTITQLQEVISEMAINYRVTGKSEIPMEKGIPPVNSFLPLKPHEGRPIPAPALSQPAPPSSAMTPTTEHFGGNPLKKSSILEPPEIVQKKLDELFTKSKGRSMADMAKEAQEKLGLSSTFTPSVLPPTPQVYDYGHRPALTKMEGLGETIWSYESSSEVPVPKKKKAVDLQEGEYYDSFSYSSSEDEAQERTKDMEKQERSKRGASHEGSQENKRPRRGSNDRDAGADADAVGNKAASQGSIMDIEVRGTSKDTSTLSQMGQGTKQDGKPVNSPNVITSEPRSDLRNSRGRQSASPRRHSHSRNLSRGKRSLSRGRRSLSRGRRSLSRGRQSPNREMRNLSRGRRSFSRGRRSLSRGRRSLSRGRRSFSRGMRSLSRGRQSPSRRGSLSRGRRSFSRGMRSPNREMPSLSRGRRSLSRGRRSLSRGRRSLSRGRQSLSRGRRSLSRGRRSFSRGRRSLSRGRRSLSRGRRSPARGRRSVSRGRRSSSLGRPCLSREGQRSMGRRSRSPRRSPFQRRGRSPLRRQSRERRSGSRSIGSLTPFSSSRSRSPHSRPPRRRTVHDDTREVYNYDKGMWEIVEQFNYDSGRWEAVEDLSESSGEEDEMNKVIAEKLREHMQEAVNSAGSSPNSRTEAQQNSGKQPGTRDIEGENTANQPTPMDVEGTKDVDAAENKIQSSKKDDINAPCSTKSEMKDEPQKMLEKEPDGNAKDKTQEKDSGKKLETEVKRDTLVKDNKTSAEKGTMVDRKPVLLKDTEKNTKTVVKDAKVAVVKDAKMEIKTSKGNDSNTKASGSESGKCNLQTSKNKTEDTHSKENAIKKGTEKNKDTIGKSTDKKDISDTTKSIDTKDSKSSRKDNLVTKDTNTLKDTSLKVTGEKDTGKGASKESAGNGKSQSKKIVQTGASSTDENTDSKVKQDKTSGEKKSTIIKLPVSKSSLDDHEIGGSLKESVYREKDKHDVKTRQVDGMSVTVSTDSHSDVGFEIAEVFEVVDDIEDVDEVEEADDNQDVDVIEDVEEDDPEENLPETDLRHKLGKRKIGPDDLRHKVQARRISKEENAEEEDETDVVLEQRVKPSLAQRLGPKRPSLEDEIQDAIGDISDALDGFKHAVDVATVGIEPMKVTVKLDEKGERCVAKEDQDHEDAKRREDGENMTRRRSHGSPRAQRRSLSRHKSRSRDRRRPSESTGRLRKRSGSRGRRSVSNGRPQVRRQRSSSRERTRRSGSRGRPKSPRPVERRRSSSFKRRRPSIERGRRPSGECVPPSSNAQGRKPSSRSASRERRRAAVVERRRRESPNRQRNKRSHSRSRDRNQATIVDRGQLGRSPDRSRASPRIGRRPLVEDRQHGRPERSISRERQRIAERSLGRPRSPTDKRLRSLSRDRRMMSPPHRRQRRSPSREPRNRSPSEDRFQHLETRDRGKGPQRYSSPSQDRIRRPPGIDGHSPSIRNADRSPRFQRSASREKVMRQSSRERFSRERGLHSQSPRRYRRSASRERGMHSQSPHRYRRSASREREIRPEPLRRSLSREHRMQYPNHDKFRSVSREGRKHNRRSYSREGRERNRRSYSREGHERNRRSYSREQGMGPQSRDRFQRPASGERIQSQERLHRRNRHSYSSERIVPQPSSPDRYRESLSQERGLRRPSFERVRPSNRASSPRSLRQRSPHKRGRTPHSQDRGRSDDDYNRGDYMGRGGDQYTDTQSSCSDREREIEIAGWRTVGDQRNVVISRETSREPPRSPYHQSPQRQFRSRSRGIRSLSRERISRPIGIRSRSRRTPISPRMRSRSPRGQRSISRGRRSRSWRSRSRGRSPGYRSNSRSPRRAKSPNPDHVSHASNEWQHQQQMPTIPYQVQPQMVQQDHFLPPEVPMEHAQHVVNTFREALNHFLEALLARPGSGASMSYADLPPGQSPVCEQLSRATGINDVGVVHRALMCLASLDPAVLHCLGTLSPGAIHRLMGGDRAGLGGLTPAELIQSVMAGTLTQQTFSRIQQEHQRKRRKKQHGANAKNIRVLR